MTCYYFISNNKAEMPQSDKVQQSYALVEIPKHFLYDYEVSLKMELGADETTFYVKTRKQRMKCGISAPSSRESRQFLRSYFIAFTFSCFQPFILVKFDHLQGLFGLNSCYVL